MSDHAHGSEHIHLATPVRAAAGWASPVLWSLGQRLALVALCLAVLWAGVYWVLSGAQGGA